MSNELLSPAEAAAEEALAKVRRCLDEHRCFRLEAGAGAGKTFSLVKALKYIVQKRGAKLLRGNQRVACITYTNVASDEIASRIDRHPAIVSSTIHAFCWSIIKDFQPRVRQELPSIADWEEKIAEELNGSGSIGTRRVAYDDRGRRKIEENAVWLHHDDVLTLMVKLLAYPKFRNLVTARYPVLLIDEYQDTNKALAEALVTHFVGAGQGPLIGFFGDHWQKIYGSGCGMIEHASLEAIGKESNFRSVPLIVGSLNRMRPELPQRVVDENAVGSVAIFHTNAWVGTRLKGQHWGGDLPAEAAHQYLEAVKTRLHTEGWDLSPEKTKILMLTHKVLAEEQKYKRIADLFKRNDTFIKKEDVHIKYLVDTIEPLCLAYNQRRFGEMFSLLGTHSPAIRCIDDKAKWSSEMNELLALRDKGTIGDVITRVKNSERLALPENVVVRERKFEQSQENGSTDEEEFIDRLGEMKQIPYQEIVALARFINERTPFATKHGVKGAEFENVLAVFGRGWNLYDFNRFLEWSESPELVSNSDKEAYERNRNLFYVISSRPKKRLAMLFTQRLTEKALGTLGDWFGKDNLVALPNQV